MPRGPQSEEDHEPHPALPCDDDSRSAGALHGVPCVGPGRLVSSPPAGPASTSFCAGPQRRVRDSSAAADAADVRPAERRFLGPAPIKDWNEGEPVPPGYHPVQRTRTGLIVGGAVLFGVFYLISAFVASVFSDSGNSGNNALWLPGVGPFIQMANTSSATGNLVLVIDGAAQSGGLAMLIYGIVSPKTVLLRNDLATTPLVLPIRVGSDGYGLGLVGHF